MSVVFVGLRLDESRKSFTPEPEESKVSDGGFAMLYFSFSAHH